MPTYEEMCKAAQTARSEWLQKRERCWGYLASIINGLVTHCGVADDQINYLKWNRQTGIGRLYEPSTGGEYTLPGATEFDEEDGFWHLGVQIVLTPQNTFPKQYVTFVLCASEDHNMPVVKVGINEKPKHVHLGNVNARNLYCDGLAQQIIDAFANPQPSTTKKIGFDVAGVHQA